jgi:hypothetical protein
MNRACLPPLRSNAFAVLVLFLALLDPSRARAWDYEGHRLINQLALASLPTNFPSFVRTASARERVAFLAGEPDRWRNSPDLSFKHCNEPDHYLDLDDLPLYGLSLSALSPFRYEFAAGLAALRLQDPTRFPPIDPQRNADKTKEWVGFLPWTITEYQGKLKSAFSYLKALQQRGTPEEITNAQENVIYLMGVMGHFVGDGSQPLHTTKYYNGWIGDNPQHYSTNRTFHRWIDGGYIRKVGVTFERLLPDIRPAKVLGSPNWPGLATNVFPAVMSYLEGSFKQVEPLYQLEKERKLSGNETGPSLGYDFMTHQLLQGAQMLGDLWMTAWQNAPSDTYLERELARRKVTLEKGGASWVP